MRPKFRLQKISTIPIEDRYCRACDKYTKSVLTLEGSTKFAFPCCDNPACQPIVEGKILQLASDESPSNTRPTGLSYGMVVLLRWWGIRVAAKQRYERELMRDHTDT